MKRRISVKTNAFFKSFADSSLLIAYRLYTVVPALLELIDNLTNWYIRLNRRRLKGESGLQSSLTGLNTLFEVLFILVRSLAPFTPFIADHLYLLLVGFLPSGLLETFEDTRSVHFLPYPSFSPELIDLDIERKVHRMQNVVSLARTSRERRTISLKTPLKNLAIIHSDQTYLSDLRSLESYICDEVNVQTVEISSDESKYDVQYTCSADWPTLGKKLRKDVQKVRKLLPTLSSEQVKGFVRDKKITIGGIDLVEEDLVVKRDVLNSEGKNIITNSDDDVLTILDLTMDDDLMQDGLAREIINRVQRLRKKAGLQATDDVGMIYRIQEDYQDVKLRDVFRSRAAMIGGVVRGSLIDEGQTPEAAHGDLIIEEEQDIQKATFSLRLMRM